MIKYDKLWELLDSMNKPKTCLLYDKVVVGQSYTNLANGDSLTMRSLDRICEYLDCQPGDILEYIKDKDVE